MAGTPPPLAPRLDDAAERDRLIDRRNERVTALHEAVRVMQIDYADVVELLNAVAASLPSAFQRPEWTAARLTYAGAASQPPLLEAGANRLSSSFRTKDGVEGRIDVVMLGEPARASSFCAEEQQWLDSLAGMLETTLNRRLSEHAHRESEGRLRLLLDINTLVLSEIRFDSLLTGVSAALDRMVPHDYIGIALCDPASRTMRLEAWLSAGGRPVTNDARRLPLDGSLEGMVFQRNAPVIFTGAEVRDLGKAGAPILTEAVVETACGLPLATARRAVGVLTFASHAANAFTPADVALMKQVAGQLAIGVENAMAYGELASDRDTLAGAKPHPEEEIRLARDFGDIIGRSPAMRHVLQLVQSVAPTDATVLLLGETGTGKELLARAVHNVSARRSHTFVKLNSAALPDQLFESELFGYEKGAFTGAISSKAGRLELAHRGSIFLDEIGDLPLDLQIKLLRVLQEREFERLGSHRTIQIDVRLIAATNRDLPRLIDDGRFRSDLYYRLNVFPIAVPALRERREDIPLLVEHFLKRTVRDLKRRPLAVDEATMDTLMRWHWPGNIRELQNTVERAVILSPGDTMTLPSGLMTLAPEPRGRRGPGDPDSAARERNAIVAALRAAQGIVSGPDGAAAKLGLKRTTLLARMRRLGVSRGQV